MSTTFLAKRAGASESVGPNRRDFMKLSGVALVGLTVGGKAVASEGPHLSEDRVGVLVDLTLCVGCRRCEFACAEENGNPHGSLEDYDDASVFAERRNPMADQYTVVNRTARPEAGADPVHCKIQCMHCEHPPCVSACLVGAMQKLPDGQVVYDASRCIGCRYCMMACPFERLAYEYDSRLTPRVRKCTLCAHRAAEGKVPACVEICPVEALQYGRRSELLKIAHDRIAKHPGKYVDHVYGEHEGGGTSWLYIADRPFDELGFPKLGDKSPAERTEFIQHGIFRGAAAPLLLSAMLFAINKISRPGGVS